MAPPLFGMSGILNPLAKINRFISIPAGYEGITRGNADGVTLS